MWNRCGLFVLLLTGCEATTAVEARTEGEKVTFEGQEVARDRPSEGPTPTATHPTANEPPVNARRNARTAPADAGPIRVERVDFGEEPPIFVLRGEPMGSERLVFLHGMCGHGLGYAQSFQHAAAKKGQLIAPQADVVCGDGPGAKWSMDVHALDARITGAFQKLGHAEPVDEIWIIGMSQGATRAAALARTFPERYTRLISMGAPTEVKVAGLEKLRAAVMMVGERERRDLMKASERALVARGVPTTSMVVPRAEHAGMGPHPEETMGAALDWLAKNARPARSSP